MTSSNEYIFRVTGPLCGEFTGPGEFPAQRPVTRNFDVFFDLRLNKRISKQSWGWWYETPSWSVWRQCNVYVGMWIVHLCIFMASVDLKYYRRFKALHLFPTPCIQGIKGFTCGKSQCKSCIPFQKQNVLSDEWLELDVCKWCDIK